MTIWIEQILDRNLKCLLKWGIRDFDQSQELFRKKLEGIGTDQVRRWQGLLLEPVYWPRIVLLPENYPIGTTPLPGSYYEKAKNGQIYWFDRNGKLVVDQEPYILQEGVYLIDTRCKPVYKDGRQMWLRDKKFLGHLIERLRQEGKVFKHRPATSRFNVSVDEAEQRLWPLLANQPDFKIVKQIRSERASEFNFISQCFDFMPRKGDGKTNTSLWFADYIEDCVNRLIGGDSNYGGLVNVNRNWSRDPWDDKSVRPLAVLS